LKREREIETTTTMMMVVVWPFGFLSGDGNVEGREREIRDLLFLLPVLRLRFFILLLFLGLSTCMENGARQSELGKSQTKTISGQAQTRT